MPQENEKSPLFDNPNTLSTMLSPSYNEGSSGFAHGFFEFDSSSGKAYWHGGNTISFSTQFGLVVLTNASSEVNILYGLQELLIGNKKLDQTTFADNLPDVNNLSGNYITMRRPEKHLWNLQAIYHLQTFKY